MGAVATLQECQTAIADLLVRLSEVDPQVRRKYAVERSVSCRVTDLDVVFRARFAEDGAVSDVTTLPDGDSESAQVGLTVSSDDLIALVEGRLGVPAAWATGRLRIDASLLDLLKLRALL